VLVVEDDPDVAEFTRLILTKRAGLTVQVTADVEAAEQLVLRTEVDAILTDIELPGGSGLELAARVRRFRPQLPIAVMTAHASVDYAITALRSQADEFLVKPVSAADLVSTMTMLAHRGLRQRLISTQRVVLAVGAHPDDVEIGVGGLLAAHRGAGEAVVVLTLTRGGRGGNADDRQHESMAAAELLGARLFLEDLVDTRISAGDPTVGIIERVVDEVGPQVVYTHSEHDRHQDHRAVHQASTVAARTVPMLACYQSPSSTVAFRPNRFVPIDGYTDTKLELLACYESQTGIRDYLEPDFVLATARYWSRFGGGRSCEPLEIVRDTTTPRAVGDAHTERPADQQEMRELRA